MTATFSSGTKTTGPEAANINPATKINPTISAPIGHVNHFDFLIFSELILLPPITIHNISLFDL
jgi:hypothetical protein